jgi:hypothetical protein
MDTKIDGLESKVDTIMNILEKESEDSSLLMVNNYIKFDIKCLILLYITHINVYYIILYRRL